MHNILKFKDIFCNSPDTLAAWQGLAKQPLFDKVLHVGARTDRLCNTLSGARHAAGKISFSFFPAIVLDDQTTRHGDGVFSTFNQEISQRSWLLQQLYAQREVVHFAHDPSLRPGRDLVLRRHRLFTGWQLNQHTDQPDHSEPSWNDSRTTWREASLPVSLRLGPVVPPGQTSTPKTGVLIHLSCNGSLHSSHTASSAGRKKSPHAQIACGNCGVDPGGVYPSTRSQLRTTGQSDCSSPSYRT